MGVIFGNIYNTVHGQPCGGAGCHIIDNDWLTRPGIEDTPEFIDANLTGSHLLEAASSRRLIFEWIKIIGLGIPLLERARFLMCGNRDLTVCAELYHAHDFPENTVLLDRDEIILTKTHDLLYRRMREPGDKIVPMRVRSEERSVGQACVSTCRACGSQKHSKK